MTWTGLFCAVFDWRLACGDSWENAFRLAAAIADRRVFG